MQLSDISRRHLEQPLVTIWKVLPVLSYNMTTILKELMNDASAVNCRLNEFETETDGPDTHS